MAARLLPLALVSIAPKSQLHRSINNHHRLLRFRLSAQSPQPTTPPVPYTPGVFDHVFLNLFRNKMVQEVGWDSEKPGYDGLIDVANRLMLARTNSQTQEAAVRILRSLFPPLLLHLYKILIAPIAQGKLAALMVARVTALSCQWLMGTCTVNTVDLPDGSSLASGVHVERCKYLEESKCVGICVNTCKLPTQAFFMDHMGVPLLMEPNFDDYSCQFKFGVFPLQEDSSLKEPCLEACPNAIRRRTSAAANTHQIDLIVYVHHHRHLLSSDRSHRLCSSSLTPPLIRSISSPLFIIADASIFSPEQNSRLHIITSTPPHQIDIDLLTSCSSSSICNGFHHRLHPCPSRLHRLDL